MFELKLKETTINLKWGTWAMREVCKDKGITIDQYFELIGAKVLDLDTIIKLIYAGYKAACNSKKEPIEYTENDVCDWIDEIGGIFSTEGQVIEYFKYIITNTVTTVTGNSTPKEEKKKSNKAKLG
jgi:hypothetical protein